MEEKISELVEKAIVELEYSDCFLVDLKVNNSKIEIYLDSDSSITFERCRKVSRQIEAVLDEEQWFGEKYTLDVSSAGIGRPLKYLRQYVKNIGRIAEVKTVNNEKVRGSLSYVDEEKITITFEEKRKEGKKNVKVTVNKDIPMAEIIETRIKISF